MSAKKNEMNEAKNPGVKKRPRQQSELDGTTEESLNPEEEVVRAPQAPTTAPNAPRSDAPASRGPGRRVVDPKEAAEKAARAKKKRQEEAKKTSERPRRAPKSEKPKKSRPAPKAQPDTDSVAGVQFADMGATMDDFAAMLAGEESAQPVRQRFEIGDTVEGTVVSVGSRFIFIDLGGATEGIADRAQYLDDQGEVTLKAGDKTEFYVIGFDGGIQLGREISAGQSALDAIETAHAAGLPISGRVTGTNKGGFVVNINGVEAFCPISQIELGFTEDPEIHVGNTYTFEVIEVREGGRTIVVSRTALLERQRAEQRKKTLASLKVDEQVEGIVSRVTDFGAFVDLGGIEGLVHVSELSHIYFDKPSDVVKEGDKVTVQILSIEEDPKRPGDLRISLSMKAAEEDPWTTVNDQFAVGETITGKVVRIAPFGAFVEIAPGIEGLVHVSEMSWKKHVATPRDVVELDEEVQVQIQDIDLMRRRISLSMKAAEEDPWEQAAGRFAIAMEVTGTVAKTEDFGAFIDLGDGITALLPRSEMNLPKDVTPHRLFSVGQEVTARVLNIEPARRRMALTLKDASQIDTGAQPKAAAPQEPSGPRSYQDEEISNKGSFGTLGDLLRAKKEK